MLHVLVDTSIWLDLAERRDGPRWTVPISAFIDQGQLQLLVPALIIDEFERNRPRVEEAATAKVRERVRLLRRDLDAYAPEDRRREVLEGMAHHIPLISAMTLQNFSAIRELLNRGKRLVPTKADQAKVVERGLEKRAPLHLNKNSVADALLIELYGSAVKRSRSNSAQYWFVTSNHQDFSVRNGDHRLPHPDIEDVFADKRSRYVYGVDGFKSALENHFSDEFTEISEETEFLHDDPRTLEEILEAEEEFFDKVWYVRSVVTSDEAVARYPDDIREGMFKARARIEAKYGRRELQKPIGRGHDKAWEYGYINGKLAALRWVLGSEWDFLDT